MRAEVTTPAAPTRGASAAGREARGGEVPRRSSPSQRGWLGPWLAVVAWSVVTVACGSSQPDGPHDPKNELPFGIVDGPGANQQVGRQVKVVGWALDDTGVREVRVYVDGRLKTAVQLDVDRPDVSKAYPNYGTRSDRHGWSAFVDLGKPGAHTIVVQAVDDTGATRDLGVIELTVTEGSRPPA